MLFDLPATHCGPAWYFPERTAGPRCLYVKGQEKRDRRVRECIDRKS